MLRGLSTWLNDRTGYRSVFASFLHGTVERNGAWLRTTGVTCLVLILVECFTGTVLALRYSASPATAYGSIGAIEADPFGHYLRGIHHWTSASLILLFGFAILRMLIGGEYGKRRDIVWLATLIGSQVILMFQITGHILPWDTNAVASAQVEAGIAGNTWVVGPQLKQFILNGKSAGEATLSLWYGAHVAILPAVLILFVGLPLLAARLRSGSMPDAEEKEEAPPSHPFEPYYPNHLAREMLVAAGLLTVIAALALFYKTPLEEQATAEALKSYTARSEWYVMPLHALTVLPPFNQVIFEPIATMILPGLLIAILAAVPLIDRNPRTGARKRTRVVLVSAAGVFIIGGLTAYGFYADKQAEANAPPKPPKVVIDTKLADAGKVLYDKNGCAACHAIAGKGGKSAPDLTKAGVAQPDRQWQIDHLVKPTSKVPSSTMPAYPNFKPDELKAFAEYLVSLR
jgi:ubiquinol-cytochrome c reductase cytochrome b subunit